MPRPPLGALLIALVPFFGVCFSVALWDRVFPMVFGLPFNIFWLIAWIPVTTLCLAIAYRLQRRNLRKAAR
jgi:hypothetical protein